MHIEFTKYQLEPGRWIVKAVWFDHEIKEFRKRETTFFKYQNKWHIEGIDPRIVYFKSLKKGIDYIKWKLDIELAYKEY